MAFEINSALLRERLNLGNFATGGVIGTAAATVDIVSSIGIAQTTAGQVLTMPTPTDPRPGRMTTVVNTGTVSFDLGGTTLAPGQFTATEYHGVAWAPTVALSSGGAAIDTVQVLNATGNVSAWGSIVEIGATPLVANITITLPACASNIGKKITFKRLDNTGFTVTIAPNGADTSEVTTPAALAAQFGAVTLEVVSSAKSEQVSNISTAIAAEYGESNSVTNGGTFSTVLADIAGSTFTLPSAGIWEVVFLILGGNGTAGAKNSVGVYDTSNTIVPNSMGAQASPSGDPLDTLTLTNKVFITTTGATQYKLRGITGSGTFTVRNNVGSILAGNGSSKITWTKTSGFLPVLGSSVDYISAMCPITSTNLTAGTDHAKFATILSSGGGVTLDTATTYTSTANVASIGRFTIKGGRTYRMSGRLGDISYTPATSNYVTFRWYNSDTSTPLGGQVTVNSDYGGGGYDGPGGNAEAIFAPMVDTRVELRIVGHGGMVSYGGGLASSQAYADIVQIGSTATTGNSFNSLVDATTANTLDNTLQTQTWNWSTATIQNPLTLAAPALTTGSLLTLTSAANSVGLTVNGRTVTAAGTTTNTTPDAVTGTINDFLERKIKNASTGTGAQSGYTAESNTGTPTSGFAWWGINNSAFANPQLYNAGVAGDVTLVGSGQSLIIANASQTQPIRFQTGKATTPFFDNRMVILNNGNVGINTTAPLTTLDVSGSFGQGFVSTAAAAYTVLATDATIQLTLGAAQVVTLPSAVSFTRRIITLVNATAFAKSTAAVYTTIRAGTSNTIPPYGTVIVQSNGGVWQQTDSSETTRSAFKAYRTTNINIPTGVATDVVFTSERYDRLNDHDITTGRFTAPQDGYYTFSTAVRIEAAAAVTGEMYVELYCIETGIGSRAGIHLTGATGGFHYGSVSADFSLSRTQRVGVRVFQNSGLSQTIGGFEAGTWFCGHSI